MKNAELLTSEAKPESISKQQRTTGIKANRIEENAQLRDKEAWTLTPEASRSSAQGEATVLTFPTGEKRQSQGLLSTSKRKKYIDAIEESERGDEDK